MRHRRGIDFGAHAAPAQRRERLKWTRHDDGSFLAWPEGREHPGRYRRLDAHRKNGGDLSGMWTYWLCYEGETEDGFADNRQVAADCANERWPRFLGELRKKQATVRAEAAIRERILGADRDPAIAIETLRLGEIDGTLLLRIIRELPDGRVRVAISAEFYSRRVGREKALGLRSNFPRTAAEFERFERRVVIRCTACWANTWIEPQALIQFLGPDGDVYDRLFTDLPNMVTCPKCEARVSEFFIVRVNDNPPYSLDERMMHEREFKAFVEARDRAIPKDPRAKPLKARRVRKFR